MKARQAGSGSPASGGVQCKIQKMKVKFQIQTGLLHMDLSVTVSCFCVPHAFSPASGSSWLFRRIQYTCTGIEELKPPTSPRVSSEASRWGDLLSSSGVGGRRL